MGFAIQVIKGTIIISENTLIYNQSQLLEAKSFTVVQIQEVYFKNIQTIEHYFSFEESKIYLNLAIFENITAFNSLLNLIQDNTLVS